MAGSPLMDKESAGSMPVWLASRGMRQRRLLPVALGLRSVLPCDMVAALGWGRRLSFVKAAEVASAWKCPVWTAEDGFIRSLGLGVNGAEPFGFVLDRQGIAFDARGPSDLEDLIRGAGVASDEVIRLCQRVVKERVSKYVATRPVLDLGSTRLRVLVVDQCLGDRSLSMGLMPPLGFAALMALAQQEFPGAELVIKVHPDVIAGRRKSCVLAQGVPPGARVISEDTDGYALIAQMAHVYVGTSQLGFEALMAGVPVTCAGAPWYAGWGLTRDLLVKSDNPGTWLSRRGVSRSVHQLFSAAYMQYSRYADPVLAEPCDLQRILDRISDDRRGRPVPGYTWHVENCSWRKRKVLARFLPACQIRSWRPGRQLGPTDTVASWGRGKLTHALANVVRIEDGFLRSVGLGSDLVPPLSLVFDPVGMYFDPGRPSALEQILSQHAFTPEELARGAALVALLRSSGVSKYNLGSIEPLTLPPSAASRTIILVPGQVENDASVLAGGGRIQSNAGLLQAVRQQEPQAFIIYKPHPDVVAGNRPGGCPEGADLVVEEARLSSCLKVAHSVHTMTSLAGFEALLAGVPVFCHGMPFYAGWGLTNDSLRCERRCRSVSLDALVYATLVAYPRNVDPASGWFIGPEAVIAILQRQGAGQSRPIRLPRWQRYFMQVGRLIPRWIRSS